MSAPAESSDKTRLHWLHDIHASGAVRETTGQLHNPGPAGVADVIGLLALPGLATLFLQ